MARVKNTDRRKRKYANQESRTDRNKANKLKRHESRLRKLEGRTRDLVGRKVRVAGEEVGVVEVLDRTDDRVKQEVEKPRGRYLVLDNGKLASRRSVKLT